eukprot:gene16060-7407_t
MLYDVLLRFLMFPVALVGDIKSAFHQILVYEKDRDSMRFLQVEDVTNEEHVLKEYRFTEVIFESCPSPYLLKCNIVKAPQEVRRRRTSSCPKCLYPNMYCDDLVSGAADCTQAIELKDKITEIMRKGGFQLHKWKTNYVDVRKHIEENSDEKNSTTVTYAKESLGIKYS